MRKMSSEENTAESPSQGKSSTTVETVDVHHVSPQDIVIILTSFQLRAILFAGTAFTVILAIGIGIWLQDDATSHWSAEPEQFRRMGPDALALFRQHDVNDDGALDLREFEPLAHILVDVNVSITYDLPINLEDNVVTIKSHFQPLDVQTMQLVSTSDEENSYEAKLRNETIKYLVDWKEPAIDMKNFAIRHFSVFIPKSANPELGESYHITPFGVQSEEDIEHFKFGGSSSNRFYPPRVAGDVITIHNLLAMLHPRPFVNTRFPPQGSLACLRAYNDDWLDISFRIHAEFQLHEPPRQPFWFTPAQFKGRLIISKDFTKLKYFKMYVPANRRLNVDMEWLQNDQEHSMQVDIGYMPEMALVSTSESRPAQWDGYDLRTSLKPETTAPEEALEGLTWTKEVQVDVCEKAMEVVFYPFKTVEYYNYTQAFDKAAEENKLVHCIALWGALDDQSC